MRKLIAVLIATLFLALPVSADGFNSPFPTLNTGLNGIGFPFSGATANTSFSNWSFSRIPASAATVNATVAKAAAGRVYKITGFNASASPKRIKFYNTAATPVPGTTAVLFTRVLPVGAFSYDMMDIGWGFTTGISYALVAGNTDADATALAAGDITDLEISYQ